jgi:hypothetical protein
MDPLNRRDFIRSLGGSVVAGTAGWNAIQSIVPARAAELQVTPELVRFAPEMESVVRWIEQTPRERVFDVAVEQLKRGLSYRQLLGGLFLAGIRNIKPRPVGFKFHAVMVIHSAHDLALDSPQPDRLLPFFWALDNFKSSQQRDVDEGDWVLGPVKQSALPGPEEARKRFVEAMERWDDEAADTAVTGLCRSAGVGELKEALWRYGARDWQNIGHKIIFTAHAFRTLDTIGWQHAEPVLRSLVFGLLNGGPSDSAAPYVANQSLVAQIRPDWAAGKPDAAAGRAMLQTLRQATPDEAARAAVELLNRGVAASSVWDGVMLAAGELLMRQPGIVALHAVTASNSMHYAFRAAGQDSTRLLALLQACSWIPLYREGVRSRLRRETDNDLPDKPLIDELQPVEHARYRLEAVFDLMTKQRLAAAQLVLSLDRSDAPSSRHFMDAARHLIFTKGTDSHDYKFAAAAFEEFRHASEAWQPHLLAASVYHLKGASDADSPLLERTRQALAVLG